MLAGMISKQQKVIPGDRNPNCRRSSEFVHFSTSGLLNRTIPTSVVLEG